VLSFPCLFLPEAFASWQWFNHVVGQVPAGKKPLVINLDETAVCLFQGTGRGTVIVGKKRKREEPVQRVNRATRRTNVTHVALICDQPAYQQYLPQFIIGNEHTFLAREMAELQRRCPGHIVLVRQKSAWNSAALMIKIVERLWSALTPFAAKVQPILLMDTVRLHWTPAVVSKCARRGVWAVPVPAKLTWLVQPCDTHMFLKYKFTLRRAAQRKREESMIAGALGVKQLLECMYEAVEVVMEDIGGWRQAFLDDGYGAKQILLSDFRKQHLELEAPPRLSAERPTVEQVKVCFPQRQQSPSMTMLFRCLSMQNSLPAPPRMPALFAPSSMPRGQRLPGRSPHVVAALGGPTGDPLAARGPRTRAEHRRAAEAAGPPSGT
jgi:hypothetical protein